MPTPRQDDEAEQTAAQDDFINDWGGGNFSSGGWFDDALGALGSESTSTTTATGPTLSPATADKNVDLRDFVSNSFRFGPQYERISEANRNTVKQFLWDFDEIVAGSSQLVRILEADGIEGLRQTGNLNLLNSLQILAGNEVFLNELVTEYLRYTYPENPSTEEAQITELRGYRIFNLVNVYRAAQATESLNSSVESQEDYITQQLKLVTGGGFEPRFDHLDTQSRLAQYILNRPGKFRADSKPLPIARWECRIGASKFLVPPTNIRVDQGFHTGSLSGAAIRQSSSPKTNLGHSDTTITMQLIFPNHESIWGFKGDRADLDIFNWDPNPIQRQDIPAVLGNMQVPGSDVPDEVIDYYLSSLRGLITQFKYSPILPVNNELLNRTFGISAVTLNNMSVATVEGFPFVLMVTLEMTKFNFQPFLPMIQHFDQAIHWGKFRQYLGRAAMALDQKVNEGFIVDKGDPLTHYTPTELMEAADRGVSMDELRYGQVEGIPRFDKVKDIYDGKNFRFFYPTTTPGRIFAPDTTDFRQPGEDQVVTQDIWDGVLSSIGLDLVKAPRFNFFEYSNAARRPTSENNVLNNWLRSNKLVWTQMNDGKRDQFVNEKIAEGRKDGSINDSNLEFMKLKYQDQWYFTFFRFLLDSDSEIQKAKKRLEDDAGYLIKEWEVPMEEAAIDWTSCIVQGVSVGLSNTFSRMQIQLQESPTYQFIGGGDSTVNVDMIVLGEGNLIRLRRVFEHINGLARLEQAHGVLGFLGIKNIITSLCGIKYVLPNNFTVQTVPNMPHVYQVQMSFVDFDVRQQQREELSNEAQRELAKSFGKRNPFLRMKQMWSWFNGYPDLPLSVKDEKGLVVGYLDPDWYFRSFITKDEDLTNWNLDGRVMTLFKQLSEIQRAISEYQSDDQTALLGLGLDQARVEQQIRDLYTNHGSELLPGYIVAEGQLKLAPEAMDPAAMADRAEMRQYLGVYGENNETAAFIDFFKGGYYMLGTEDTSSNESKYIMGLTQFREDLASVNNRGVGSIPNTTPLSEYQNEYIDKSASPAKQFETMMQDFDYRNLKGRMIKAFPTYMLWLIDEGGKFAGIKLFDNFYGLNSIIDYSVVQSQDAIGDTLVMRVSNIYSKLTTPYREGVISEDDPIYETPVGKWINQVENRQRNVDSGLTNKLIELNHIRLKPGVRVHLRMGYGSNPNALQTVFNGVITEVEQGDIMTVIAQSDAVELTAMVNSTDAKGSSGKLDGGMNTGLWMSEPRDLIVRLLSMGSSYFKEWVAWGTKGVIFSESKFGIRHFGSILYEPMNDKERQGSSSVYGSVLYAATDAREGGNANADQFASLIGGQAQTISEIDKVISLPSLFNGNMLRLAGMMWVNSFTHRDYELFKRNIYPGNGTGIAQFMGGDMIDAGIMMGQATAVYDGTSSSITDTMPGGAVDPDQFPRSSNPLQTTQNLIDNAISEWKRQNPGRTPEDQVEQIWQTYEDINFGLSDEEILEIMRQRDLTSTDLTAIRPEDESGWGLFENLINNTFDFGLYVATGGPARDLILDPLKGLIDGAGLDGWVGGVLKAPIEITTFLKDFRKPIGMMRRMTSSPVGRAMGLWSTMEDDDLQGYDEVSFRAQTYMKTVWDLLKLCAALLPNYIVAVRPFEDRSTIFYGKPHWLYTSGVIPVSSGVPNNDTARPRREGPSPQLTSLMNEAAKEGGDLAKLTKLAEDTDSLKDIMQFSASDTIDPNDIAGLGDGSDPTRFQNQEIDALIATLLESEELDDEDVGPSRRALTQLRSELVDFSSDELQAFWDDTIWEADSDSDEVYDKIIDSFTEKMAKARQERTEQAEAARAGGLLEQWRSQDEANTDEFSRQVMDAVLASSGVSDFAERDPITFAYQFGWKLSYVPVWIDPNSGFGVDVVGNLARQKWDEDYSVSTDAIGSGRTMSQATDIWRDIRTEDFRGQSELVDIFNRIYPDPIVADTGAAQNQPTTGEDTGAPATSASNPALFQQILDLFMRFLWQDPYNRAWVVMVVDRGGDGLGDTLNPFGDNSRKWSWARVNRAFETFITNEVTLDDADVPHSGATRRFMESNEQQGKNASNIFAGMWEDAGDWVDSNIGQIMGMLTDTLTGFVASIRLSLAQMGNALSQSGEMQRQSNILNAAFNDSIYYSLGNPGDLTRMVDNPFTREYGEPVVEIREPFQRIHFISSFDAILNNGIMENLNDVPTVVTAVSDGKNPVTVHFDKGIPPDRQVTKIVETGLFWDNAYGSGLFGMLQPLLHPLETMRSYSKAALGSSDELSSRRVALSHLKEGLKDIYQGEILIIGDADIRPHDLLYIADVYERMYGMVEVDQVIHHFTPETGFVTAITPNAIVTVNDPARWTMLSYVWSKMSNYNVRDDVRAMMGVQTDRNLASATKEIKQADVYQNFSTQLNGAIQYTQGNSGLVKDIAAMFSGGGTDELWGQVAKMDILIGGTKGATTVAGGVGGAVIGGPVGAGIGAVGGFVIGDLLWEGWQWVKENLLDQHGCYIQFLNKDGQPMDAGLSYYSGVAVGSNHSVEMFPNVLGLGDVSYNIRDENGHYRITTNDLMASIGWSEVETTSLFRETSLYVNQINSQILRLANRGVVEIEGTNLATIWAEIIFPEGEGGPEGEQGHIVDGDTFDIRIIDAGNSGLEGGGTRRIRLASVNTFELQYKNNPYTAYNETLNNDPNDMAVLAYNYLVNRFRVGDRHVAIRLDKQGMTDDYDRLVGVVFHNAPIGTEPTKKKEVLMEIAGRDPLIPWDAFLDDGRPYTLNWEMVMTGYGNVDMRESLWDTGWRRDAIFNPGE